MKWVAAVAGEAAAQTSPEDFQINCLNAAGFCPGANGWRTPTLFECRTVVEAAVPAATQNPGRSRIGVCPALA